MSTRRDFLKKGAILTGAGLTGAALMRGLDRSVLAAPPAAASGVLNQWNNVESASALVWADSAGAYYAKDIGIGNQLGALIVNANVITGYGAALGAGTAGVSTTTAAIQEAINCLRRTDSLTNGSVYLAGSAQPYKTTTTITSYPGIGIKGPGLLSAFQNIGAAEIQPANALNAPVIQMVLDPANTGDVVFPRFEGFAINGPGVANTSQDGIKLSIVNGDVLDVYINDVGLFNLGGNGINIADSGGAMKVWVNDVYIEGCLQNGINQLGGYLRVRGGYQTGHALAGITSVSSQQLEVYETKILNCPSGAIVATGPISQGVTIEGCTFWANGGTTTPQVSLTGLTSAQAFSLLGNRYAETRSVGKVANHVKIGSSSGGLIQGDNFSGSTAIAIDPGSFNNLIINSCYGLHPIGVVASPFLTNHFNYLHGNAAVPTASTDYGLYTGAMVITAANSANANNAILIKDKVGGATVFGPVSTLSAQFIPAGFAVNWGAFTGAAGAVTAAWA